MIFLFFFVMDIRRGFVMVVIFISRVLDWVCYTRIVFKVESRKFLLGVIWKEGSFLFFFLVTRGCGFFFVIG